MGPAALRPERRVKDAKIWFITPKMHEIIKSSHQCLQHVKKKIVGGSEGADHCQFKQGLPFEA